MKKLLFILILCVNCTTDPEPEPLQQQSVTYTDVLGEWTFQSSAVSGTFEIVKFGATYYVDEGSAFTVNGKAYTTARLKLDDYSVGRISFTLYHASTNLAVAFSGYTVDKVYRNLVGIGYRYGVGADVVTVTETLTITRPD